MSDKNWAVVHDSATRYVGVVEGESEGSVTLSEAFELVLLKMPQQVPGRGVAIAMVVHPTPIGLAEGPTSIRVRWSARELFSQMDERDRATYEKLVEDARRSFQERRAEAAGIVLPKG